MSRVYSLETILTTNVNDAEDNWSMVWSTEHIPGMDNATGGGPRRLVGRRRLRRGALALGCYLTMHCHVLSSVVSGGFFIYILFLAVGVALLGNQMRHFEVFLGQWSMNGPGRAFRILPMFDGLGIAMCIVSIVKAMCCCVMAAATGIYVVRAFNDQPLPSTHCRTFDLEPYEPVIMTAGLDVSFTGPNIHRNVEIFNMDAHGNSTSDSTRLLLQQIPYLKIDNNGSRVTKLRQRVRSLTEVSVSVCSEMYNNGYPFIFSTPAENYFYVEVMRYREGELDFRIVNYALLLAICVVYAIIWAVLLAEKLQNGKMIWNNVRPALLYVPWAWGAALLAVAVTNIVQVSKVPLALFELSPSEFFKNAINGIENAIYFHASGTGTELIYGKGLNHYSSGTTDPLLQTETVWFSALTLATALINASGVTVCAVADYIQPQLTAVNPLFNLTDSSMWVLPVLAKCTLIGEYSHFLTVVIFSGMCFSYIFTAFIFLKTALHAIFEYRVKLVFYEQLVVALLILGCFGCSIITTTAFGLPFLEATKLLINGVSVPMICTLELVGVLYVYRGRDFVSDMELATDETACTSHLGTQWKIMPAIVLLTMIMKIVWSVRSQLPAPSLLLAMAPALAVAAALPLRALCNTFKFFKLTPKK